MQCTLQIINVGIVGRVGLDARRWSGGRSAEFAGTLRSHAHRSGNYVKY